MVVVCGTGQLIKKKRVKPNAFFNLGTQIKDNGLEFNKF